jgi:hypothetical protein
VLDGSSHTYLRSLAQIREKRQDDAILTGALAARCDGSSRHQVREQASPPFARSASRLRVWLSSFIPPQLFPPVSPSARLRPLLPVTFSTPTGHSAHNPVNERYRDLSPTGVGVKTADTHWVRTASECLITNLRFRRSRSASGRERLEGPSVCDRAGVVHADECCQLRRQRPSEVLTSASKSSAGYGYLSKTASHEAGSRGTISNMSGESSGGLGLPKYHRSKDQQHWVASKRRTANLIQSLWTAAGQTLRRDPAFLCLLVQCGWGNSGRRESMLLASWSGPLWRFNLAHPQGR